MNNSWHLLKTTSSVPVSSRLKVLWEYVIRGRLPNVTVEVWVRYHKKLIAAVALKVRYERAE